MRGILNFVLIFFGTAFILWLSTLGEIELTEKVEFYTTTLGNVLIVGLFFAPLQFVMIYIAKNSLQFKKICALISVLICFQLVVISLVPYIFIATDEAAAIATSSILNKR